MRNASVGFLILLLSILNNVSAHEPLEEKEQAYFTWTSTRLDLLPYGWGFQVSPEEQSNFTIEHAHESKFGDFFMFFDGYTYHETDPGADENSWYGEATLRLSPAKIFKTDNSFFIFEDVLAAASYELGEESENAQALLLGLGFNLKESFRKDLAGIIKGWVGLWRFIQLNVWIRKELSKDPQVDGFSTLQVSMSGGFEFNIDKSIFLFDGWFDWVLGNGPPESQFHIQPQLKVDVGNYWNWPNKFYVGTELDFWWNKFGIKDTPEFNTNQFAASILLKYYL